MGRRLFVLVGVAALVVGGLIGLPPAMAATISVTCPGDSLQAAIDGADPGDSITIAAGTCAETVRVDKNLTITGAGRTATIIDGSGTGASTIEIDAATTVTISHVAVTGGDAPANGGGIVVEPGATLSLSHADVRDNRALRGAGIYSHVGSTTNLTSVTITRNEAAGAGSGGGGMRLVGQLFATDVQIISNQAETGGGLMLPGTAPMADLTNVTIRGNTATTGSGGGILNNGELIIRSGDISDNQAPDDGGGIKSSGSGASVSVTNATIADNTSQGDGAGIHGSEGPVAVDRSTISGNEVTGVGGVGGGLYVEGTATLDITNSTVSGNTAPNAGGGIATASSELTTVVHSTITGNTASTWGGGGVAVGSGPGVRVTASILAGNTASSGPDCKPGVTSTGHNIVGDTTDCLVAPAIIPDMLDTDPMLGPLRDNGGPTMSHAPATGSPALDVFSGPCGGGVVVDQRNLARPLHPVHDECDIGAIENYPPQPVDDTYSVQMGGTLTVRDPGPLENDTDREGHPIRWSHSHPDEPSHGTLTHHELGSFTYVHDGSDATTDSFRYYVTDGTPTFTSGTVTITITPIPHVEHTVGMVDPSQGRWHLRNTVGAVTSFYFGNPGDYPIMGDWDCDGVETPGLYRQTDGYVYLSNANESRVADIRFFFGNPGDVPLAGDFDGDGCDTVSIYRPDQGQVFIINELGENEGGLGAAEYTYYFGNPGDKPFVGDFTGEGIETIGLHRESTGLVYFRNSHTAGSADAEFIFGDPGDRLVCGDWGVVDGVGSPGLFRPGNTTVYLRHSNTQGVADEEFAWGESGWLPVAGAFGLG